MAQLLGPAHSILRACFHRMIMIKGFNLFLAMHGQIRAKY